VGKKRRGNAFSKVHMISRTPDALPLQKKAIVSQSRHMLLCFCNPILSCVPKSHRNRDRSPGGEQSLSHPASANERSALPRASALYMCCSRLIEEVSISYTPLPLPPHSLPRRPTRPTSQRVRTSVPVSKGALRLS
jgi:hypothetical protein